MKLFAPQHRLDVTLVIFIWLAVAVGLLLLASASSVVSFQKFGWSYFYLSRQVLAGVIPGLILFLIFAIFDQERIWRMSRLIFIINLLALGLVLIPGIGVSLGGASRWLDLKIFSFQPSELVKFTFLLYLITWLTSKSPQDIKSWSSGVLPFLWRVILVTGLLILQPDMGTAVVILGVSLAVFYIAGGRHTVIVLLIALGAGIFYLLIKMAPYRLSRLTAFLNPELDPQGIGYHINQALLAIGSGGFWGRGLGHSIQKYQYLPEVTGDSIFAVVAEELGFVLTSLVILLLAGIVWRIWRLAQLAGSEIGSLFCFGVGCWLAIQIFVNIGAMLGILPLTGIPLPFVSHGGTALTSLLAALGLVVNISCTTKKVESRR